MMECKFDELLFLVMELFFCYIYIGNVIFIEENVENIVVVFDYLIIQSFKDIGCQFLESFLLFLRCFGLRDFVEKYSCEVFKFVVISYIVKYFIEVCDIEVFKMIDYKVYVEIIV